MINAFFVLPKSPIKNLEFMLEHFWLNKVYNILEWKFLKIYFISQTNGVYTQITG